jgi:hypothetical protein
LQQHSVQKSSTLHLKTWNIKYSVDLGCTGIGYPAKLNAGYWISGRIFNSASKYLIKYEINEDILCIEGFFFPY